MKKIADWFGIGRLALVVFVAILAAVLVFGVGNMPAAAVVVVSVAAIGFVVGSRWSWLNKRKEVALIINQEIRAHAMPGTAVYDVATNKFFYTAGTVTHVLGSGDAMLQAIDLWGFIKRHWQRFGTLPADT